MSTATQKLLELVRRANGGCTDYRLHKILEVGESTVSRWHAGHGHMSQASVVRACKEARELDVFRWQCKVGAERETGAEGNFYRQMLADFSKVDKKIPLPRDSWLRALMEGLPTKVAAILSAALLAGLPRHSEASTISPSFSTSDDLYIMRSFGRRKKWREALRKFISSWGYFRPAALAFP